MKKKPAAASSILEENLRSKNEKILSDKILTTRRHVAPLKRRPDPQAAMTRKAQVAKKELLSWLDEDPGQQNRSPEFDRRGGASKIPSKETGYKTKDWKFF